MNSFNESTAKDSLPGQFMKWADEKMPLLGFALGVTGEGFRKMEMLGFENGSACVAA